MQRPTTSTSVSSHFSRAAAGSSAGVDARRCVVGQMSRRSAIVGEAWRPSDLIPQPHAAAAEPAAGWPARRCPKVTTSMMMPSTEMAARSPLSLRSKISTEITLVSEVNSMIAADNSRMVPTNTKHQVAITEVRSSGAVISRKRAQPRGAEDAAGVLQLRMDRPERRLHLLIGGRHAQRQEGEQQNPQRAVEHERRPRVAQEQPDAEHDAGDRDRRGGEEAERAVAGHRLARGEVARSPRRGRCRWSRWRCRARRCCRARAWWRESSKNTK